MRSEESEKAKEVLEKIEKLKNAADQSLVNTRSPETFKLQIKPDKTISPGKFKADPKVPSTYLAHPQTIRAMKKNIFAVGDDIDELVELYLCHSCQTELDKQFWHFCPYCGTEFQK